MSVRVYESVPMCVCVCACAYVYVYLCVRVCVCLAEKSKPQKSGGKGQMLDREMATGSGGRSREQGERCSVF